MGLLGRPHGRLAPEPKAKRAARPNALGETEVALGFNGLPLSEDDAPHAEAQAPLGAVEKALVELTAISKTLTPRARASGGDALDQVFEGGSQPSTEQADGSGGISQRRAAATLRALRRTLTENPEVISRMIKEKMLAMSR